jgi:hypothetical protein
LPGPSLFDSIRWLFRVSAVASYTPAHSRKSVRLFGGSVVPNEPPNPRKVELPDDFLDALTRHTEDEERG